MSRCGECRGPEERDEEVDKLYKERDLLRAACQTMQDHADDTGQCAVCDADASVCDDEDGCLGATIRAVLQVRGENAGAESASRGGDSHGLVSTGIAPLTDADRLAAIPELIEALDSRWMADQLPKHWRKERMLPLTDLAKDFKAIMAEAVRCALAQPGDPRHPRSRSGGDGQGTSRVDAIGRWNRRPDRTDERLRTLEEAATVVESRLQVHHAHPASIIGGVLRDCADAIRALRDRDPVGKS